MKKKPFKMKLTIMVYILCLVSIGFYSILLFRYPEQALLANFFFLSLILFIISALLCIYLVRSVTRPIEDYARQMELEQALEQNRSLYYETVCMLTNAIEVKDQYTGGHSERVKNYAVQIGEQLGLTDEELQNLIYGSLLHDIGKIGISEEILCKDGKLSDYEMRQIRQHPEIGFTILHSTQFLKGCRRMVYEHHERFDGLGYPQGLKGLDIDLYARIISVADSFDAMTTVRPYRKIPFTKEDALNELLKNSGTQFDPVIVNAFLNTFTKGNAGW